MRENSHNTRTSDDIDMKLRQDTKLDKRNKSTTKKLAMMSFIQYMVNLEQSESWIQDT